LPHVLEKDTKNKILKGAESIFMKVGVKSTTMDDVSRELGISKKTLYQYFSDKSDLVKQTVDHTFSCEEAYFSHLHAERKNPIDEVLCIVKRVNQTMRHVNPMTINDLKKYYHDSWKRFDQHKRSFIAKMVKSNLENGKAEGYYRSDLNTEIICRLYVEIIGLTVNNELFPDDEYSFHDIYHEFINYHLRGVCTPKGIKYLENKTTQL